MRDQKSFVYWVLLPSLVQVPYHSLLRLFYSFLRLLSDPMVTGNFEVTVLDTGEVLHSKKHCWSG